MMKTTAKKYFALLLAGLLILSLFWGCGGKNETGAPGAADAASGGTAAQDGDPAPAEAAAGAFPEKLLFFKDGEVWMTDAAGAGPTQITQDFQTYFYEEYEGQCADAVSAAASCGLFRFTADGKTLFYPQLTAESTSTIDYSYKETETYSLYKRQTDDPSAPPVPIAENVYSYIPSPDGSRVLYAAKAWNGDAGERPTSLWLYDAQSAQNTLLYDGTINAYLALLFSPEADAATFSAPDDNALYYWRLGEAPARIDSGGWPIYVRSDAMYYVKNNCIYIYTPGEGARILTSGVYFEDYESVLTVGVYETGEMYYFKDERPLRYIDYLTDRYAEEDAAMSEPGSADQYESYEAYLAAQEAYREKEKRDRARALLDDDYEHRLYLYTLCYYDGEKEIVLRDNVAWSFFLYEDLPDKVKACSFNAYHDVDISDLDLDTYAENAYSLVGKAFTSDGYWAHETLACSTQVAVFDTVYPEYYGMLVSPDGGRIYLARRNEAGTTDVYTADFNGKTVDEPKLYLKTEKKSVQMMGFVRGELCWGEITEDHYYPDEICVGADTTKTYPEFYAGRTWGSLIDSEGCVLQVSDGTLVRFDGESGTVLNGAGYVQWDYNRLPNGKVAYLLKAEYGAESGALYVWDNGQSALIADGVTALIPTDGQDMVANLSEKQYNPGSIDMFYYVTQR